jgi:carboxypeptidase C (cathepsin A)
MRTFGTRASLVALAATLVATSPLVAQTDPTDDAARAGFAASLLGNGKRVTDHTVTIRGARVDYSATVGGIALQDSAKQPSAIVVFMAYTRRGITNANQRPVTFAWNGGPSGPSSGVHFGVLGPRIRTVDAQGQAVTPTTLSDNPNSVLDRTDLVMVDPVGTGLSVPVGAYKLQYFYSIRKDAASVA